MILDFFLKTMKSKSFDLKAASSEKGKLSKSFDFVGLYKPAAETNTKLQEKRKSAENSNIESVSSSIKNGTPRREYSPNKKKKKSKCETGDVSIPNIDGHYVKPAEARSSPATNTQATSTPYSSRKGQDPAPTVKSIMKNKAATDDTMTDSIADTPTGKPKKRNKSVSFMLDDNEEVAIKKVKSEESLRLKPGASLSKVKTKHNKYEEKKKLKKLKSAQAEKENAQVNMETDQGGKQKDVADRNVKSKDKGKPLLAEVTTDSPASEEQTNQEKKKKFKKLKKRKKVEENSDPTENESNNNEEPASSHKAKKLKKKKHAKSTSAQDTTETDGEPVTKSRKKEVKPEIIAEDLGNLSIGDNPHTLTNLLDEMTVADKDKKKKNKLRRKKDPTKPVSVSSSETADLEKIEEGKEKVKWKKRKWNKDKKGDGVDDDTLATSVIVENLPLNIMCNYKTLLSEHFGNNGLIKKIGIAEVYPTEEPKPVFTTTITFYSEAGATKALEEDNTYYEGSRIRVKRPLPPTQTTLVVRSYGELTEQSLSSIFSGAGRIRSIRHLVKGRKAMATAFIVFDGPEAVEKAIKMAEDARIGGKKLHVCKFELRASKKGQKKNPESENEGDSEDSND